MGEFGAVSVISGNIIGRTQTLTLFVESAYKEYNTEGAFSAAVILSTLAIATIFVKDWLERQNSAEKWSMGHNTSQAAKHSDEFFTRPLQVYTVTVL